MNEYLMKKYGIGDEEKKEEKKKKPKEKGSGKGKNPGGLKIVDQDAEDWKRTQNYMEEEKSDAYSMLVKEFMKTKEGIQRDEDPEDPVFEDLETAQIVSNPFKVREDSQWETFEIGSGAKFNQKESSPKRARHDSPDASLLRKTRADASPPRRTRHDSPDASPPRKTRADASPPKRTRHDSPDASPPRRTKHDSPDASPPRRPRQGSEDISPPRKQNKASKDASPSRRKASPSPDRSGGRFAETVYRDKQGKKVDIKLEKLKASTAQKEREEKELKHMAWGHGLVQKKQAQARADYLSKVAAAPFATYKQDLARDEDIKNVDRWGDPMAGLVSKKKKDDGPQRPKYKGVAPPNRFGILPGYRWDGVDRSNGFEKKSLMKESSKEADREEAYKWSVADM